MNTNNTFYQSIITPIIVTGLALMIPLIAMQFTDEVSWSPADFIIMGALLFGTGFTYKMITRNTGKIAYRISVAFALSTGFLLIWVNLAVGIIGSENNPINLFYFGVIAVGIIGALISLFQSEKLVYVMLSMAATQALITVIALTGDLQNSPHSSVAEIVGINAFFIFLFIVSALLFRYAAQDQSLTEQNGSTRNPVPGK
jgi:hypothetical protein